jgi:hypothetical protein
MKYALVTTHHSDLSVNKWRCPIQTFMAVLFINPVDENFMEPQDMVPKMGGLKFIVRSAIYWMAKCTFGSGSDGRTFVE